MKNQGVVKFFAIALVLVCIYQLSFTVKAWMIDNEIEEITKGNPELKKRYIDSISTEGVYNLGVRDFTYLEVKKNQLNLGLDLQGGMNVVLEISVVDIIKALANNPQSPELNRALDSAIRQKERNPQTNIINEFVKQFKIVAPAQTLSSVFFSPENNSKINLKSSDDEVVSFLQKETDESVQRSFKILEARIDQFGVTQPTIQLLSGSNRVMVELPGVDNPGRVRRLLQNTAKLEFWNVYTNNNVEGYAILEQANKAYKAKLDLDSVGKNDTATKVAPTNTPTIPTDAAIAPTIIEDTTKKGDSAGIKNDSTRIADSIRKAAAAKDTSKKQLTDAERRREAPLFSAGLIPNIFENKETRSQELAPGPVIGYAQFKDTATINKILHMTEVIEAIPDNVVFAWDNKPIEKNSPYFNLYALRSEPGGGPALEGDVVTDARVSLDQSGKIEISMAMDLVGAKQWETITEKAAKDNQRAVAIVLDGAVYSAPSVNNKISNGNSSISGSFTQEEANDLASILKAGKMPAPARIVQEAIVGPSLGEASITAGLISIFVGFLAVILIVYLFYNTAGLIADMAVLLNLFFMLGTLASFGAALTLPGIAGIILTLAMAVDANVLIYERVKDELEAGKSLRNAIQLGYKNAAAAIIDGNVTTLLAGVVLYIFGSGLILGFAITLIIGIISSLFTAFLLTRVVFEWMMKREKQVSFSFSFTKNILRNANFNFIGNRKWFYICSSVIIIVGAGSMLTKGFDLGVDFEGGWSYVVKFDKQVDATKTREALTKPLDDKAPEVKVYGTEGNSLKITTSYLINSMDTGAAQKVLSRLDSTFKAMGTPNYTVESLDKVEATVADDLKRDAFISIVVALIGMFIYIQIRFKRWQFALSTIIKLAHDSLVMLSLFSLLDGIVPFTLEIDQGFIAAILTIIGYSINDSVVVFDRVREYLNEHKKETNTFDIVNKALNSTLSRTIITGITSIAVVFILFLFGGETIRGFSFALTIGIIVGTYSSLCIGSPLAVDMTKNLGNTTTKATA